MFKKFWARLKRTDYFDSPSQPVPPPLPTSSSSTNSKPKPSRSRGWKTAEELLAELNSNPEWVRAHAEREEKRRQREAELAANQAPLIADLNAASPPFNVKSVYDLVNTSASYPQLIPVLIKHLPYPYNDRIREGIARAMTVKEARGPGARAILDELKKRAETRMDLTLKWALGSVSLVTRQRFDGSGRRQHG